MLFVLKIPSLQHLASVKIVAHLWSQSDVLNHIVNGRAVSSLTEDEMKSKVSALPVPDIIKEKLVNFIQPIGLETIRWCRYNTRKYNRSQCLAILLGHHLCWSMHGSVDYAKTAQLMVKNESLDVEIRFELACIHCLEDEAGEMFERMGAERRQEYVNRVKNARKPEASRQLITFFTCTLSGEVDPLNRIYARIRPNESTNQRLFLDALHWGTRGTCEYFLTKVDQREKDEALVNYNMGECILEQTPACSLLYYLSLLNEEQQRCIFRESTWDVLVCLLRWPLQSLFVEAANSVWHTMETEECAEVFYAITHKIKPASQDYDYSQLFWECWRFTSHSSKQSHLNDNVFLSCLLETGRAEFVGLVREEAPPHVILEMRQYWPELKETS